MHKTCTAPGGDDAPEGSVKFVEVSDVVREVSVADCVTG